MKWNKQLQQALIVISVLSSVAFYWLFAYELKRSNFTLLTVLFSLSFLAYALIYKLKSNFKLSWFIAIAIFFRLLFLFSIPSLSDDFFRFLWDGQLLVNGINPYALLPTEVQLSFPNKELLLSQMNSPIYYSIYPPLNQLFFAIPALISPQSILGSVVVLRLIIISAEIGTLLILPKLLKQLALSPHKSLLYALNPLVIVELTGNLHFEALWVFALLGSIYLLQKKQLYLSSIFWAAAASIKLIPLLFLPALMRMLSSSKWMRYYVLTALVFG
ncbi:MAG: mannosyltransferase, partial [Vicingaceae bacterium]